MKNKKEKSKSMIHPYANRRDLPLFTFYFLLFTLICLILAFGNPHSTSWPLKCPLYQFTGLQCPLCGMQRAIHELLHGNIAEAWTLNPGFFMFSPYWLAILIGLMFPNLQKNNVIIRFCFRNKTILIAIIALVIWGIARNSI